jgi:hypothetical protein
MDHYGKLLSAGCRLACDLQITVTGCALGLGAERTLFTWRLICHWSPAAKRGRNVTKKPLTGGG